MRGPQVGAAARSRCATPMIYFRNNPSILFWEAGNTVVTVEHMRQMVALRKQWDPDGGRVMGARGNDNVAANTATTPIAEYYGVMIGQDPRTDQLWNRRARLEPCSAATARERRDRAPLIETEDFRDEGARRYWDDYSPPYFGFKKGPNDTYAIHVRRASRSPESRVTGHIGRIGFRTPIRRTRSGPPMRRSISPIRMLTGGRIRAKSPV